MSFDFARLINEPALWIAVFVVVLISGITLFVKTEDKKTKGSKVNLKIKKENPKVVDTVPCGEIENLAQFKDGKLVMCRCWRSETFPYCDGSHVKHNEQTGDNVGPLIIKK